MTPQGKSTLVALAKLGRKDRRRKTRPWGYTATEIVTFMDDLPDRAKPVMTVSSYLTHLKREGMVERRASTDKRVAWWRLTQKGEKQVAS